MPEQYQERQIAVKLRIQELNEGNYVVNEGWEPNYLLVKEGRKVSRVNLVGVVLSREERGTVTNLVLDDGSGKIIVRSFEASKNLDSIEVGEVILVVGKIRMFNNEKYISPEIIKKVDKNWLKLRSLELAKKGKGEEEKVAEVEETKTEEKKEEIYDLADEKIIDLIKELDKGEGALIEEVREKSTVDNTEEIIDKLLKDGEIFQNVSGRVKVL